MKKVAIITSDPLFANKLYLQISNHPDFECVMVVGSVAEFLKELQIQRELGFTNRIDEILVCRSDRKGVIPMFKGRFWDNFASMAMAG